ncbi:MAG: antitoxin Xre/MbcA/ParS toxin-binding domain-containing protein [Betaproteobacteria bacterium]
MNAVPARVAVTAARTPAPASDATVLSRAVVRAARLLGLPQRGVAAVLGVSEATASRLFAGKYLLAREHAKEWELAVLFVRMFRSLDALWGHEESARQWLGSPNLALGGRPAELMHSVEGMVRVVAYLDAARGRL